MPNFRYTARGRPQIRHRLTKRVENFGLRSAIAIFDLLAMRYRSLVLFRIFAIIVSAYLCPRHRSQTYVLSLPMPACKQWPTLSLTPPAAAFPSRGAIPATSSSLSAASHQGNVHSLDCGEFVRIHFRENHLFRQSQVVIAAAVEGIGIQAAEVANPGQRQRNQPIEELVHPLAAKRYLAADGHALAELEVGDRLAAQA